MRYVDPKEERKGIIMIIIGLLLLAVALSWCLYNVWDAHRAAKASDDILERMELLIEPAKANSFNDPSSQISDGKVPVMATQEIDGYDYIGYINVPALNLTVPVMDTWDYTRLKISACRYTGSYFTDDLVVCAHNYAKHFSPLRQIEVGEDVYLIDVNGDTIHYEVVECETVEPTDIAKMIDDTQDKWDLTLFTCNIGGQSRFAVRCKQTEL